MKVPISVLDRLILFLLSLTVLVDMVNGFFIMELVKLPISQIYKLIILVLMILRVSLTKDILFLVIILFVFQISPLMGLLKTVDIFSYFKDVAIAAKWTTVPIAFFYFKNLFQSSNFSWALKWVKYTVLMATLFIIINMILGALGFGMSFYFHGYGNAVGTKGFIYAGNELTILILIIAFLNACYLKLKNKYSLYLLNAVIFLIISFLITSKTVLGGVVIVLLIPWISQFSKKVSNKWLQKIFLIILIGIPFLISIFYYGITETAIIDKMKISQKMNDGDFLQSLLSNRNNLLLDGWSIFLNDFNWFERLSGLGQTYYVNLADSIPELDFFTILFTNGIIGLLMLLIIIYYWFLNAKHLSKFKDFIFSNSVKLIIFFLIISSNLAGHIFSSAIAGLYIGMAIAIMFINKQSIKKTP